MTSSPRRPPPLPLTVITGFLGAGKTTLLNKLLREPALADTAVLINEFGEIGLDHLLVEQVADGVVMLASGCLCCTIRGDLVSALEKLLRDLDNGRVSFRRVVIETTGLADPAPVLQTIMVHPYLMLRYRLDGVVTLVDAVHGAATLDMHPESVKQVAVADRLVLTKTDLLSNAGQQSERIRLEGRLRRLNPAAPILQAADANAARLLDCGLYDPDGKIPDVRRWLAEEAYQAADGHAHHHHDVNRHDDRIRAFTLATEKAIPSATFDMFLDLVRAMHGPNLLRLKGIVQLAEAPEQPVVIHGVQHVLHPAVHLPGWPDADRRTRLVFIARDLEPRIVEGLFAAFLGAARVDAPDAAALADNPLVPFGGLDR